MGRIRDGLIKALGGVPRSHITERVDDRSGRGPEKQFKGLTYEQMWKFYEANDWLRAIVDIEVAVASSVDPKVVPRHPASGSTPQVTKDHIKVIEDFLYDPNTEDESFYHIRLKSLLDLLIMDAGCVEITYDDDSTPVNLYNISGEWVVRRTDQHGRLPDERAYALKIPFKTTDKSTIYWDRKEMIYMMAHPRSRSAYGLSPVETLARTISSDILANDYNAQFFLNFGESSGILALLNASESDVKALRAYWKAEIQGKPHRLMITNQEAKYSKMAESNKDMEFMDYERWLLQKMMSIYRMQAIVLGIRDIGTGKLNSQQQIHAFKEYAIKPLLRLEEYHYTAQLVKRGFGFDDVAIKFKDIDRVDVLSQVTVDKADLQNGVRTINEVRAERGDPPVAWGDEPYVPGMQIGAQAGSSESRGREPGEPPRTQPVVRPRVVSAGYRAADEIARLRREVQAVLVNDGDDADIH